MEDVESASAAEQRSVEGDADGQIRTDLSPFHSDTPLRAVQRDSSSLSEDDFIEPRAALRKRVTSLHGTLERE